MTLSKREREAVAVIERGGYFRDMGTVQWTPEYRLCDASGAFVPGIGTRTMLALRAKGLSAPWKCPNGVGKEGK